MFCFPSPLPLPQLSYLLGLWKQSPARPLTFSFCPPRLLLSSCQSRAIQRSYSNSYSKLFKAILTWKPSTRALHWCSLTYTTKSKPFAGVLLKIRTPHLLSFPTSSTPLWQPQTGCCCLHRPRRLPVKTFAHPGTSVWSSRLILCFSPPSPPPWPF